MLRFFGHFVTTCRISSLGHQKHPKTKSLKFMHILGFAGRDVPVHHETCWMFLLVIHDEELRGG